MPLGLGGIAALQSSLAADCPAAGRSHLVPVRFYYHGFYVMENAYVRSAAEATHGVPAKSGTSAVRRLLEVVIVLLARSLPIHPLFLAHPTKSTRRRLAARTRRNARRGQQQPRGRLGHGDAGGEGFVVAVAHAVADDRAAVGADAGGVRQDSSTRRRPGRRPGRRARPTAAPCRRRSSSGTPRRADVGRRS